MKNFVLFLLIVGVLSSKISPAKAESQITRAQVEHELIVTQVNIDKLLEAKKSHSLTFPLLLIIGGGAGLIGGALSSSLGIILSAYSNGSNPYHTLTLGGAGILLVGGVALVVGIVQMGSVSKKRKRLHIKAKRLQARWDRLIERWQGMRKQSHVPTPQKTLVSLSM
ncbi:MAG TPA: hypothetical protein DCE42_09950 [Myxococcales bacterium]|nr:hypothetical protein [Deltaproteobacteria bacterium]HAA55071.1 hypothetical protein [Myxococcales bacterium]